MVDSAPQWEAVLRREKEKNQADPNYRRSRHRSRSYVNIFMLWLTVLLVLDFKEGQGSRASSLGLTNRVPLRFLPFASSLLSISPLWWALSHPHKVPLHLLFPPSTLPFSPALFFTFSLHPLLKLPSCSGIPSPLPQNLAL